MGAALMVGVRFEPQRTAPRVGHDRGLHDVITVLPVEHRPLALEIHWHLRGHVGAVDHAALRAHGVEMGLEVLQTADRAGRARRAEPVVDQQRLEFVAPVPHAALMDPEHRGGRPGRRTLAEMGQRHQQSPLEGGGLPARARRPFAVLAVLPAAFRGVRQRRQPAGQVREL